MRIKLICIGKIKRSYWQDAAADYMHRISKYYALEVSELKDGPKHLSPQERIQVETQAIQAKISSRDMSICLDSRGRTLSSPQMGQKLKAWLEEPGSCPCFILGGAYGLAEQVTAKSSMLLSFGPMTLPHELARIVLLEQLYRASTIIHNHPYHH